MNLRDHLRKDALRRREEAGLPVINCPNCGVLVDHRSGHWVPNTLDENGLLVHGYYTCEVTA